MTALPTGLRTRRVTIGEADNTTLQPLVTLVNAIQAERQPRSSDFVVDEYRRLATGVGSVRAHHVVIDEADAVVAYARTSYADDGSNPSLLDLSIAVHPDHRRRGIGSALLGHAVATARDLGKSMLTGELFDTVPAAAKFVEAVGARKTLEMHTNVVRIEDLDLDLLRDWQSTGREQARGYSLVVIDGMYPDDLLDGMTHLYEVLDRDAPRPEGIEPRTWTAGLIREWFDRWLGGVSLLTAIAVEDASGRPVGMSQLGRRHSDDDTWFVTTTMVDPEHRGHSLGKWVKAASSLAAIDAWPKGQWIETSNASTNQHMLAINHAMGFRHESTVTEVELPVETATKFLDSR